MLDQAIPVLFVVILATHGAWYHWKAGERWSQQDERSARHNAFLGATAFSVAFLFIFDYTLLGRYFHDPLSWKVGVYAVATALFVSVGCVGISVWFHSFASSYLGKVKEERQ